VERQPLLLAVLWSQWQASVGLAAAEAAEAQVVAMLHSAAVLSTQRRALMKRAVAEAAEAQVVAMLHSVAIL
jgi:hypothetical protein